jgi:hypothetical protein
MMVWKFGGGEPILADAGFSQYDNVAGIMLGPNPVVFWETCFGDAETAAERAGFFNAADIVAALKWLFNHFKPEEGNLRLELTQSTKTHDWKVSKVEKEVSEK